jgi:hypothetical protein
MTAPVVWELVSGSALMQGDLLPSCNVPFYDDLPLAAVPGAVVFSGEIVAALEAYDVIVLTQSCDLDNTKVRTVATCPVFALEEFESLGMKMTKAAQWWEDIRKGRQAGLHLLPPPDTDDVRKSLIVDFRVIYSLPLHYVMKHADAIGGRWRLLSPQREHLSNRFGGYFSRVAV